MNINFIYKTVLTTLLVVFFSLFNLLAAVETLIEKPMVIVIVSYNNMKWCQQNIQSALMQNYSNYRIIYVDDCSTDGTGDIIQQEIKNSGQEDKVIFIRNEIRAGTALANHYKAITDYCKNDEIILCLDGDDWFAHYEVLNVINKIYSTHDVWLTHGTLSEYHLDHRNGLTCWSIPIPSEIIQKNTFRRFRCATHLKTFYAGLFKKIKLEDLLYDGVFYPVTGDQALMFPMIEMAGTRHAFIREVLYIYNMTNPLGDSIVSTLLQRECEKHIRDRAPYEPLAEADFLNDYN